MDIWQRILAAKDERTAKRVSIFSGLGMLPFYIIFPLVGMAIKIVLGNDIDSKDVTYLFIERHTSPFILGFAVVGLMSALMSSGDSFLNIISISAIKDFAGWKKKPEKINTKKLHRDIRIISVIFGLTALAMALIMPKIVDLMVVGIASIVIFVPVSFLALIKKEVHQYKKQALYSLLLGFIVNLTFFVWGTISPEQMNNKSSFIPAFIVASIVLLIGVMIKNKKIKAQL